MKCRGLPRIQDFIASNLMRRFDVPVKDIKALKRLEEVELPNEVAQIFLGNDWVVAVIEPERVNTPRKPKVVAVDIDENKQKTIDKDKEE